MLDLAAQPVHLDVHGPFVGAAGAPQGVARDGRAGGGGEHLQHLALAVGEPDELLALPQFAALDREDEGAEPDGGGVRTRLARRRAAQDRGDAQQQFARLVGLGEVVVGPDLEPAHPVVRIG